MNSISEPVVIDTKAATITVSPRADGWTVIGISKTRIHNGGPATYTAEIKACGCDEPSTCKLGWHEPKVLRLAQRTSKTYI